MKKDIHEIAIRIYQLCLEHKIEFELEWIPCTDILKAGFLSRFIDTDYWQITRECFDTLERLWGYHIIDCFANYYNTKTSRFISWHWNPGCTGVDFFVQNLSGENCLVVPPICKSYYESTVLSTNTKSASNSYCSILDFALFLACYN